MFCLQQQKTQYIIVIEDSREYTITKKYWATVVMAEEERLLDNAKTIYSRTCPVRVVEKEIELDQLH